MASFLSRFKPDSEISAIVIGGRQVEEIRLDENLEHADSGRMSEWISSSKSWQDLADLHRRFYPTIRAFIASRVSSAADAEDIAQDVFVELHKKNGWHEGLEDPETYVFGIAKNLIRQYYRKRAKSVKAIPIEEIGPIAAGHDRRQDSDPESRIRKQELTEAIEEVLTKLPPKARQALKLRFVHGLTTKEAAKMCGCTPSTVRKRIFRSLQSIRLHAHSRNESQKK
jgi:RNA polymerase sigma-70 factor (ECF subfamily)